MASIRLPSNPRARAAVTSALALVVVVLVTQVLLPGAPGGSSSRGTPAAVLFSGLVQGSLTALIAAGLILIYRSQRIVNFAQTALGTAGATFCFQLLTLTGTPFIIAFPLGLAVAAAIGVVFELIIVRRFFQSPRLVLTVLTIAAAGFLGASSSQAINSLPFLPRDRDIETSLGAGPIRDRLPFPGFSFRVGGSSLRFGFPEVFSLEMAFITLLLVAAFLRYTRAGVGIRALAENSERASLLGISVGKLSTMVWAVAGALAGVTAILTGCLTSPAAARGTAPAILLPGLAAAVLAKMRSFPVAVAASLAIGVLVQAAAFSLTKDTGLISVGLFLVVAVGLVVQRRTLLRSEQGGGGVAWAATEEQRPIPRELRGITSLKVSRFAIAGAILAFVVAYPFFVSTGPQQLGGVIALFAIIALSALVLTGWTGQVSLGQFGFAAVGSLVGAGLTNRVGVPFWFAVPIAALVAAAVAVLVGIPALRIKGLFLAVATFAFAIAVSATLFNPRYFGWILPKDEVKRPTLFLLNFADERSMYYLCVALLVLAIVAVGNLRRSRFGRTLIALRENEANVQSFGVSVVRMKLQAFAVSGALAGTAGAVFAHLQRGVSADSFVPQRSVDLFLLAVLGGIGSVPGVLLGSLFFNIGNYFLAGGVIYDTLQPSLVLLILYVAPGGLISLFNKGRDSVLRIVAQRRQIVVPSLFADYDADALERKLIPLGEASGSSGLAALGPAVRYAFSSELFTGKGAKRLAHTTPRKAIGDGSNGTPVADAGVPAELTSLLEPVGSALGNGAAE